MDGGKFKFWHLSDACSLRNFGCNYLRASCTVDSPVITAIVQSTAIDIYELTTLSYGISLDGPKIVIPGKDTFVFKKLLLTYSTIVLIQLTLICS